MTLKAPGRTGRAASQAPAKPAPAAAKPSSEPKGIMVPTGKVAKCSGINARMAKVRLQVEDVITLVYIGRYSDYFFHLTWEAPTDKW